MITWLRVATFNPYEIRMQEQEGRTLFRSLHSVPSLLRSQHRETTTLDYTLSIVALKATAALFTSRKSSAMCSCPNLCWTVD